MIENNSISYHQIVDLALVFCIWFAALLLIHKNYRKAFFLLSSLILTLFFLLNWLNLPLLEGVANQAFWVSFILLMIVFQPELRRMFERIRHLQDFLPFLFEKPSKSPSTIKALLSCVSQLAESQTGALIVLENRSNLDEYADSGIKIDAKISTELLVSLFKSKGSLHDGAILINHQRLTYAGCLLPLTEMEVTDRRLGTRHRAALGLSEISDAVIIIVSGENGTISLAEAGKLTRFLNTQALETRLFDLYKEQ